MSIAQEATPSEWDFAPSEPVSNWLLSLREGVQLQRDADTLVFQTAFGRVELREPAAAPLAALSEAAELESDLTTQAANSGGIDLLTRFYYVLRQLVERGLIVRSAQISGRPLASLIPTSFSFRFPTSILETDHWYRLSRFAFLRHVDGQPQLESPLSHARLLLHDARVSALLHLLSEPSQPTQLADRLSDLSESAIALILQLLQIGGFLEASDTREFHEDRTPVLRSWEFHDLLFHARSREGRHDSFCGTTYALAGEMAPLPVIKPANGCASVPLPQPDLEQLASTDPPLSRVMEERCSIREYADSPMHLDQLSEFLYRVARVKRRFTVEAETPWGVRQLEATSRPYPGGGALYELEIYPVVQRCHELEAGLYHYDPAAHRLHRYSGATAEVEQLLTDAAHCMAATPETLQVLLVLTARFQRVSWKYSGLAYSLILKDVGILFQSMYLAATAMGLAPCALGGGNSDLFAHAIGSDYYEETSVGEFLLGSRPASVVS